jgi:hypothetical protein
LPPTAAAPQRGSLASWCWRRECVTEPATRDALLDFARSQAVDTLYVKLRERFVHDTRVLDLVRAARDRGVRVQWVTGAREWVLPAHQPSALAPLDWADTINRSLRTAGLPTVEQVAYDVEPYLLPAWNQDRSAVESDYQRMAAALHARARTLGLSLWLTLPFWWERELGEAPGALQHADGVIVMAYRNDAQAVGELAEPLLARAAALSLPVVVAVETKCVEPAYVSFCGSGAARLDHDLSVLRQRFAKRANVHGLAVHELGAWRTLTQPQAALR